MAHLLTSIRWSRLPLVAVLVAVIAIVAAGLFLLGVGDARTPSGESDSITRIDSFVQSEVDASRIPGLALAIVEGDRIVHARGFGNDGTGQFITPQTPFWIGSNTKSFTALATMQLAEAGKLDIDAPVQRYLPEFAVADPEASSRITVRHLLNQTSGFSRTDGIKPLLEERNQTLEEAVADMRRLKPNRPVGETFEYSNLNFVVLGLLIERISGERWGDYIQRHIFEPLEMQNSFTSLEDARDNGLTKVHGYWFGLPRETEELYLEALAPTGWLYSTAEDMGHYLAMYLNGGIYRGSRLLSERGIDEMLRPATNATQRGLQGHEFTYQYGEGWFVGPFGAAEDARWHLGNLPTFTAWMVLLPDTDQAAVVLINAGSQFEIAGANSVMSRIPLGVVAILRGEDPPSGLSITQFFLLFNAAVLAIVIVQVWSLFRVSTRELRTPFSLSGYGLAAIPLLWEFGLSLYILLTFPASLGVTWLQSFQQMPDLTLVLLTVAGLWLVTGVVRIVRLSLASRGYQEGRAAATY